MDDDADLTTLEDAFTARFAAAIAADVAEHPVAGALERLVLRWFDDDPLYFTLHLLGSDEQDRSTAGDEAWLPLEWANSERELPRGERVEAAVGLFELAAPVLAHYAAETEQIVEAQDAGEVFETSAGGGVSRAIWQTLRLLPAALDAAGVPRTASFAMTATAFEGYGGLDVFRELASPEVFAAYEARDELPEE